METRFKNLISDYNITIVEGINLGMKIKPSNEDLDFIRANKPAIIDYIKSEQIAKEKAAEERKRKIESIDGLKELENAIYEHEFYHDEFEKRMQNENFSSFAPKKPKSNIVELKVKYPRAAAYLLAKSWYHANNDVKSDAGKKALERIINGENYESVLKDMDDEWSTYCSKRIWD